jgi:hypothetical protein
MHTILHHLKKDALRLRIYLLVWFVPLVLATLQFCGLDIGELLQSIGIQIPLPGLGFAGLVALFMVPVLIHEDPLVDDTAFWLTRPISNGELLGAKTVFLGILVTGMTLVKYLSLARLEAGASETWSGTLFYLSQEAALLCYLALASAVTAHFRSFFLYAILGPVFCGILAIIIGVFIHHFFLSAAPMFRWGYNSAYPSQPGGGAWINWLLVLLAGYGILGYQYYARRTRITLAWALGAGTLILLIGMLSPTFAS